MKTTQSFAIPAHQSSRVVAQNEPVDDSSAVRRAGAKTQTRRRKDQARGHLLLRLMLGASFTFHGVNRLISGIRAFEQTMVGQFSDSFLPGWAVSAFATTLPFVEGVLGVLLLLGWQTRWVLLGVGLMMVSLTVGSGSIGDWNAIGLQLLHALVIYQAIIRLEHNLYSLDGFLAGKNAAGSGLD
jgi:thiosulfate dehydrogenase [quinone] large subunit